MVEFDVSMFAFERVFGILGIRQVFAPQLWPAYTGIIPGTKKGGYENGMKKPIQNHPPKWRLLFFPWLYPTSSRCSSFVALKFSMLHIPLHGTHHAISCPLPRTSSPTHGWESVLRWHWGFRHGESPHFTMFGQWSLISLFLLHCCCGEGCVFFCSQEMSAATFKTHQHGRFESETTQTSTIQASVQQRPLGGHMVNGVDQVKWTCALGSSSRSDHLENKQWRGPNFTLNRHKKHSEHQWTGHISKAFKIMRHVW